MLKALMKWVWIVGMMVSVATIAYLTCQELAGSHEDEASYGVAKAMAVLLGITGIAGLFGFWIRWRYQCAAFFDHLVSHGALYLIASLLPFGGRGYSKPHSSSPGQGLLRYFKRLRCLLDQSQIADFDISMDDVNRDRQDKLAHGCTSLTVRLFVLRAGGLSVLAFVRTSLTRALKTALGQQIK